MILTGFQLRAARRVLNLHLEQLHQNTGISKVTLSRLENTIGNLEDISCSAKDAEMLLNYFNNNKLIFPSKSTIALDVEVEAKSVKHNLTRFQFIVARAATNLSQRTIAMHLNLTYSSIYQFEGRPNTNYLKSYKITIESIINFFINLGVSFPNNKSVSIYPTPKSLLK